MFLFPFMNTSVRRRFVDKQLTARDKAQSQAFLATWPLDMDDADVDVVLYARSVR